MPKNQTKSEKKLSQEKLPSRRRSRATAPPGTLKHTICKQLGQIHWLAIDVGRLDEPGQPKRKNAAQVVGHRLCGNLHDSATQVEAMLGHAIVIPLDSPLAADVVRVAVSAVGGNKARAADALSIARYQLYAALAQSEPAADAASTAPA
jgi:hypothetical protein